MRSRAVKSFWERFEGIQRAAIKQFRLWLQDPRHPSLQFKRVGRFWSARVSDDYRAVGVFEDDTVIWFFIGTHAEYERLLKAT